MWPYLTTLVVLGLLILHWWWRGRYVRLQQRHREELTRLSGDARSAAERTISRQRAVFDGMIEGLLLLDKDGRVQMANRRFVQFFGLGDEMRDRTVLESTRSHELAEIATSVERDGRMLSVTLRLPGPEERHLEVNAAPILNADGISEGTVMVLHDVTRLQQLEKTREEFVANVSHELRTPLSLIKGYSETLLESAGEDPAVVRKFVGTINRNAQRLQVIIEDLLSISSLESGKVQPKLRTVSVKELVGPVVEDYESSALTREMTLRQELPDLEVRADTEQLHQILGNLVDNAIKYGKPKGEVVIRARKTTDAMVELSVSDNGPGIPSDALKRIFERFYRVDKARSRDQGGTGLGLSIVKHIVQSHGGKVWAESELSKGTTIYFTVPQTGS